MPTKKSKVAKKRSPRSSEVDDVEIDQIDIQYNPDIVFGLLDELKQHVDVKCAQIQKDSDFLCTSVQQAFHLELIKLPTQVKQMSIKRFKEEYGYSLEAVTKGAIVRGTSEKSENTSHAGSHRISQRFYQTPAAKHGGASIMRAPREGEQLMSKNGSPLGEFSTVKKAGGKASIFQSSTDTVFDGNILNPSIPPPTPGVFVPLKNGEIIDLSEGNDLESLPAAAKEETLEKMMEVINNMQSLMTKLKTSTV